MLHNLIRFDTAEIAIEKVFNLHLFLFKEYPTCYTSVYHNRPIIARIVLMLLQCPKIIETLVPAFCWDLFYL